MLLGPSNGAQAVHCSAGRRHYENQKVRVAPFSEARTIPVYNYRTVKSGCRPPRGCVYTRVRVAPFSTTVQVDVFNYQTRKVRVAPFTKTGQVPLFNYQTRQVRVAPTHKTETVDVFNYENRRVRVAPFTKTVTVNVENYENKKVRVAPFTKTVTQHDPTQHTCPNGQHMKPFPNVWVHMVSGDVTFDPEVASESWSYVQQTEWVEMDSHAGCHKPRYPQTERVPIPWGRIGNAIKNAVSAAVNTVEGVGIAAVETYVTLPVAPPPSYQSLYLALCWEHSALARDLAAWGLAGQLVTAAAKRLGLAVIVTNYGVAPHACPRLPDPFENDEQTTTTTTTTTTLPPTAARFLW